MKPGATNAPRIAALLTCHNRRNSTLECLNRLAAQQDHGGQVDVVVLDAASTDGTPEAIAATFDNATVLRGRADQFWNRGMHVAFEHAVTQGGYDFYLWVNDDTYLDDDALARMLHTYRGLRDAEGEALIIVGSTRDPDSGHVSYGGMRRGGGPSTLRFERVPPDASHPRRADTMNGNVVLIARAVVDRIGIIDPAFFHGLGDFDYGLRATAARCSVWVAPATIGTCRPNKYPVGRWQRLKMVFGRRRTRLGEWYVFVRRWGGRRWPLLLVAPYYRHAVLALTRKDDSELADAR